MKSVTFTMINGNPITIFIGSSHIVVLKSKDGITCICDGIHNNGGWQVKESYNEVISKISKSKE